jgi:hypothetical protein
MSITGLLLRFLLLYPPLLMVAGLAARYFDFKPSGLNFFMFVRLTGRQMKKRNWRADMNMRRKRLAVADALR